MYFKSCCELDNFKKFM